MKVNNKISPLQNKRVFVLLNQLGWTAERDTIVPQFCEDRTTHVSELTELEAERFIVFMESAMSLHASVNHVFSQPMAKKLEKPADTEGAEPPPVAPKPKANNDPSAISMRRKILYLLGNLGYIVAETGKFDYPKIEGFIQNIGSNNPDKKGFNYLETAQYAAIITQIEQIMKKKYVGK